jgi:hypothetical protein
MLKEMGILVLTTALLNNCAAHCEYYSLDQEGATLS